MQPITILIKPPSLTRVMTSPPRAPSVVENPIPKKPEGYHSEKLTLNSFVSSFQSYKSFNETKLESLGIDLNSNQPLLPDIYSVLSELPMPSVKPNSVPNSYKNLNFEGNVLNRIELFPVQTLILRFILKGNPKFKKRQQRN